MSTNLYQAHLQWVSRSPDERFNSLDDLYNFTYQRKTNSTQSLRELADLSLCTATDGSLSLNGSEAPAELTNWSFGQLATLAKAPAGYLRSLSPSLAKECLDYGMRSSRQSCKVFYRNESSDNGSSARHTVAAFTGPTYGRVWDADVISELQEVTNGTSWKTPGELSSAHRRGGTGLYASDRDMFVFMVNEEDAIDVGGAKLGRGFFCWNSETGSSTLGLMTFLYNYVCANHIVWGAEHVREVNVYHRRHAQGHFYRDALPVLNSFVRNSALIDDIKSMVNATREYRLGEDRDGIIKRLSSGRFTQTEVKRGWEAAFDQGEDPRSVWGMVQGLTATAQEIPYMDRRVNLERRAGNLLEVKLA